MPTNDKPVLYDQVKTNLINQSINIIIKEYLGIFLIKRQVEK